MLQSDYLDAWRPPKDFTQILDFTLAFPTVKLAPLLFCLYAAQQETSPSHTRGIGDADIGDFAGRLIRHPDRVRRARRNYQCAALVAARSFRMSQSKPEAWPNQKRWDIDNVDSGVVRAENVENGSSLNDYDIHIHAAASMVLAIKISAGLHFYCLDRAQRLLANPNRREPYKNVWDANLPQTRGVRASRLDHVGPGPGNCRSLRVRSAEGRHRS